MKILKFLWYILWSVGYVMLWFRYVGPFEWGKKRNVSTTAREWKYRHIMAPVYTLGMAFIIWTILLQMGIVTL